MTYPAMPGYPVYSQYPQPYQDRLAQLQSQYQQTMPQAQTMQQNVNQGLLWVQGEMAARSYLVAPNSTVLLMDSDANRFYLKSADSAGMPNLRTFEYTELRLDAPQPSQKPVENLDDKYVTRDEYNGLRAEYAVIMDKLNNFPAVAMDKDPSNGTAPKGNAGRSKGGNTDEQSVV